MPTFKMAASNTLLYDEAIDTIADNQAGLETTESAKSFIKALSSKIVQHMLASIFKRSVDMKLKPLEDRVTKIEVCDDRREERISELEEKIDEVQQKERENNAIITGMEKSDPTIEDVRRVLNERLGLALGIYDIKLTRKLNQPRINNNEITNRVRVEFATKDIKREVMKSKKKLKGGTKLWMNNDLIPN